MLELERLFSLSGLHTAFEREYQSDYVFSGEQHNFWELVTVLEGEIEVTAGCEVLRLQKGQAILHEPMEFHALRNKSGDGMQLAVFSFDALHMPRLEGRLFQLPSVDEVRERVRDLRESFVCEGYCLKSVAPLHGSRHQLAVRRLECFMLELFSEHPYREQVPATRTTRNYCAAVRVLEKNIDKSLRVSELAALCRMSEVNLKKLFSRYAGVGVISYFNRLKMTRAVAMLKSGMSAKESAAALGFANQNYFSTVFKRIHGVPPSFYK